MSRLDFLKEILPSGTRYSLRLVKKPTDGTKSIARNEMYNSIEDMESAIDGWVSKGWNVYYATAGFGAVNNAQSDNAVAKRELYVDVDCGPDKPYATKEEGLNALKSFVVTMKLPRPTLVDSGNGIHAHWIFDTAVPIHQWESVALALKEQCVSHNFQVDGACTADIVRVLRIPDTTNFRGNHTVRLLTPIKYFKYDDLAAILGQPSGTATVGGVDLSKAKALSKKSGELGEIAKLLASNRTSKYETILLKSVEGEGCGQIKWAFENQDNVPEPLWRANLSVANFCEDRDWGIHEISKGHPNYDASETESKASQTKGPYTCETFQGLGMEHLCQGCKFRGTITSPIQIGSEIAKAPDEPVEVVQNDVGYVIPRYPSPYFRGRYGGVYLRTTDGLEEVVYPHDFYAYNRMYDKEHGDVVCFRYHTPKDGVREFVIPATELGAREKFRAEINKNGVIAFEEGQVRKLQAYVEKQVRELQMESKAELMHARFGWTQDQTFIIGNREYTSDGVRIVPLARELEQYVDLFGVKGSLDTWKEIADFYNKPEFDAQAVGVLAGFASMLMKFSPENGFVLNYYSKGSGTGKTTLLKMINSITGNPNDLMKQSADTAMTKIHRMGIYNGICVTVDEMSNATPHEVSELLYNSTQGRARDRMQSGKNAERVNNIRWKGFTVSTMNANMEDKLGTIKIDPHGELARVLEIYLPKLPHTDVLESLKLFTKLNDNYGHAAHVFMGFVMQQGPEKIKQLFDVVQAKVYKKHLWTQTERYKLNGAIAIICAGVICNQLGLLSYNMTRITQYLCAMIKERSEEMLANGLTVAEMFATFINKNINNMLIISDKARNGTMSQMIAPDLVPRNTLLIRYETDTNALYVSQRDFNKWAIENALNVRELKSSFKQETGKDLTLIKKRMGKGWNKDFGPVMTYEILNAKAVLGMELDADVLATTSTAQNPED